MKSFWRGVLILFFWSCSFEGEVDEREALHTFVKVGDRNILVEEKDMDKINLMVPETTQAKVHKNNLVKGEAIQISHFKGHSLP